ncbi:MAG: GNAT family N-acetyltransferase [Deltaproteobacteria bacterium]|nr:GNAT family N-acetyltransferase [Deltaproteobacteria bacterium]
MLWALRVIPPFQRASIASALVHGTEEQAGRRGMRFVELAVEKDNAAARRLYERLGYRPVRESVWMTSCMRRRTAPRVSGRPISS